MPRKKGGSFLEIAMVTISNQTRSLEVHFLKIQSDAHDAKNGQHDQGCNPPHNDSLATSISQKKWLPDLLQQPWIDQPSVESFLFFESRDPIIPRDP